MSDHYRAKSEVDAFIRLHSGCPREGSLSGPSMSFEASRAALRFGYTSTKEWLAAQGTALMRRFALVDLPTSVATDCG